MTRYRTIVADPPWEYDRGDGPKARALTGRYAGEYSPLNGVNTRRERYGAIPTAALLALRPPAEGDAHLYLWTTNQFMVEAHEIARAWGFAPKTILTWTKTHAGDPTRVSMKMGYYFRGATEHVVFAVRGSLRLQVRPRIGEHSAKFEVRAGRRLQRRAADRLPVLNEVVERIGLFARRARFGWDYWGDESLGTAVMPDAAA